MHLGILTLPAGVYQPGVTQPPKNGGTKIWREGDAPIPVFALEEIGVTAKRDYLPAVLAGLILIYVLTDRKGVRL